MSSRWQEIRVLSPAEVKALNDAVTQAAVGIADDLLSGSRRAGLDTPVPQDRYPSSETFLEIHDALVLAVESKRYLDQLNDAQLDGHPDLRQKIALLDERNRVLVNGWELFLMAYLVEMSTLPANEENLASVGAALQILPIIRHFVLDDDFSFFAEMMGNFAASASWVQPHFLAAMQITVTEFMADMLSKVTEAQNFGDTEAENKARAILKEEFERSEELARTIVAVESRQLDGRNNIFWEAHLAARVIQTSPSANPEFDSGEPVDAANNDRNALAIAAATDIVRSCWLRGVRPTVVRVDLITGSRRSTKGNAQPTKHAVSRKAPQSAFNDPECLTTRTLSLATMLGEIVTNRFLFIDHLVRTAQQNEADPMSNLLSDLADGSQVLADYQPLIHELNLLRVSIASSPERFNAEKGAASRDTAFLDAVSEQLQQLRRPQLDKSDFAHLDPRSNPLDYTNWFGQNPWMGQALPKNQLVFHQSPNVSWVEPHLGKGGR